MPLNTPTTGESHDGRDEFASDRSIVLAVSDTDESRADLIADTVASIAGPTYATVHILHVYTPSRFDQTLKSLGFDTEASPTPDEVVERANVVREIATRLNDPARNYGMDIQIHGRISENIGATIVDVTRELSAEFVIVGGRKRSPTGKVIFKSTAQYVLLNAPCPVLFVRME